MSQIEEVVIISSDEEETPPTDSAKIRRLVEEWPEFRVAYDEWMYCPDYEATAHEILLVAEKVPGLPDRSTWVEDAVRNIYRRISDSEVLEEDLIGLSFTSWRHERQHPVVVIGMRRKAQVKKYDLLKAFEGIERDRPTFLTNGPLVVKFKHVKRKNHQRDADVTHFHQRCLNKKCILSVGVPQSPVENLSRALALSEAYIRKEKSSEMSKEYDRLRMRKEIYLHETARALLRTATKATDEDVDTALRDFDSYYTKTFTITVFLGLDGRQVLYESWAPPVEGRSQIDIVTDGREFHVVKPDKEAFSSGPKWQYCRLCRVHYRFQAEHECLECCRHCRKVGVCIPHHGISCRACKRDFVSDYCFKRHLEKSRAVKSTCDMLKKCKTCLEWYSDEGSSKRHNCGQRFCQNCRDMRPATHTCHASRQSNQVRAPSEARNNNRSPRGAADNSDSAKRRRLDVGTSVHTATRGRREEVVPSGAASTSHEPVDKFDSTEVEAANSSSDPAMRSPTASTAANLRRSTPSTEIRLSLRHPSLTRPSLRSETARAAENRSSGPAGRSPTTSTAADPRSTERRTGSIQNTSAEPANRQASPAAGNQPSEGEEVRDGLQRGGAFVPPADLPNEGGNIAAFPVSGYGYHQNGEIKLQLSIPLP